jgi:hypothetical protein
MYRVKRPLGSRPSGSKQRGRRTAVAQYTSHIQNKRDAACDLNAMGRKNLGSGMDKAEFINLAPEYYMLAVVLELQSAYGYVSETALIDAYTVADEPDADGFCYIENRGLLREAIRLLAKHGGLETLSDPFGPSLYRATNELNNLVAVFEKDFTSPFYKSKQAPNRGAWLRSALSKLNQTGLELGITNEDLDKPEAQWTPIQIDQDDPIVKDAVQKLSKTVEDIETDNGYSAEHPQERDKVVHDLTGSLAKLKSNSISPEWIRTALDGLRVAGRRFANTVKAQTIEGTKQAIIEFVKTHMADALSYLASFF